MALRDVDVLFISTHLGKYEAGYRRIEYFLKYFQSRRFDVSCIGVVHATASGIVKPFEKCYSIPFGVSSNSLAFFPINFVSSLFLIPLILTLRHKMIIVSIPDSYIILSSYIGSLLTRSKLIIDVRDPQEEIMVYRYKKGFSGLIAKIYRKINYSIYRKADGVLGVTKKLVRTIAKEIWRPVYLIPNGADLSNFKPLGKKEAREKLGLSLGSLLIGYVGALSSYGYYNILPVLEAIRKIRRELDIDIKLVVAGSIYDDGIKRIAESFGDEFKYLGVLDTKGVVTLLSASDLGIIPRIGDPIYDYAIPAKFYEYVAIGLPLLTMANRGSELARIVEKYKLGFVCDPGDQVCIEKAISMLVSSRSLLDEIRKNVLDYRKNVDRSIGAERLFRLISELMHVDERNV
jgi:glycosyltransferase involved in cell wall biosynthesis